MATTGNALMSFFPRIEPTIPRDIQRHFQLIYTTLNNHAQALTSLPKSTGTQPVTIKTFSPKLDDSIPREVQRHLQLIYKGINNHGMAFTQLPKLNLPKNVQFTQTQQSLSPHIEPQIPPVVQLHLQLIYGRLDNHGQAIEFYKQNMPAS
jgi:hypothetical protein